MVEPKDEFIKAWEEYDDTPCNCSNCRVMRMILEYIREDEDEDTGY